MSLELGITPVKFVIMGRRVNFLYYILNESTESIINQVYAALKEDSRRGDFNHLVPKKVLDLNIDMTGNEIKLSPKWQWKKYVKERVKSAALAFLINEKKKPRMSILMNFVSVNI